MMIDYYILTDDDRIINTDDVIACFSGRYRIAETFVDDIHISTVFLRFDHGFNLSPLQGEVVVPILFETMIFGEPTAINELQWRYTTVKEAKTGHKCAVGLVLHQIWIYK